MIITDTSETKARRLKRIRHISEMSTLREEKYQSEGPTAHRCKDTIIFLRLFFLLEKFSTIKFYSFRTIFSRPIRSNWPGENQRISPGGRLSGSFCCWGSGTFSNRRRKNSARIGPRGDPTRNAGRTKYSATNPWQIALALSICRQGDDGHHWPQKSDYAICWSESKWTSGLDCLARNPYLHLIGFRNKIFVFLNWCWSYLTFRKGARLIVNQDCYRAD